MNLDQIVGLELKSKNEPSSNADKISGIDVETGEENDESVKDSSGNYFDSQIHAVDANGEPVKTITGRWRKKRGSTATKNNEKIAAREAGRATAETIFALSVAMLGDEWTPVYDKKAGINERQQMIDAWAIYYEATGNTEMSPWVAVAVACGSYGLPRLQAPKTRSRLQKFVGWINSKIIKRKK